MDDLSSGSRVFGISKSSGYTYIVLNINADGSLTMASKINGSSDFTYKSTSNEVIIPGVWTQIAVIQDGVNGVALYKNGVEVAGSYLVGNLKTDWFKRIDDNGSGTNKFYLGAGHINSSITSHLPGSFDEIRVYNRALTSQEITDLYIGSSTSGGTSLWTSSGTTIFYNNGPVGVGTSVVPPDFDFAVAGKGIMEEVKVEASPWPDFVFAEGYPLSPLTETKAYIQAHKHLPGIPSAEVVAENGILVGEMNAKLLEKIEELTLHTINQEEKIQSQDRLIKELFSRVEKLEQAPPANK